MNKKQIETALTRMTKKELVVLCNYYNVCNTGNRKMHNLLVFSKKENSN